MKRITLTRERLNTAIEVAGFFPDEIVLGPRQLRDLRDEEGRVGARLIFNQPSFAPKRWYFCGIPLTIEEEMDGFKLRAAGKPQEFEVALGELRTSADWRLRWP